MTSRETIDSDETNLHLVLYRKYLVDSQAWWNIINSNVLWQRVKYVSNRFGKPCETPCYTAFYGGCVQFQPFAPVPPWLQPLVDMVSAELGVPFNALLLRLYFDGSDEIAWHTDGRTFLGPAPTIGSLSLGATAQFEMRRMRNVWPKVGPPKDGEPHDDGVDRATAPLSLALADGDLIVMRGDTQAHWHHRVPKAKSRRPRININFRYIIPGTDDAERGQATYYKYMRDGDVPEQGLSYEQIVKKSGSLLGFASWGAGAVATSEAAGAPSTAPSIASPTAPSAVPSTVPIPSTVPFTAPSTAPSAVPYTVSAPYTAPEAAPAPSITMAAQLVVDRGRWACPQCTLLNPPLAPVCAVCEYRRHCAGDAEHQPRRDPVAPRHDQVAPTSAQAAVAIKRRRSEERTLSSMWGGE